MSPASRAAVVASLPAYIPFEECASEGDVHFDAKATVKGALRAYFERSRRKVYVAAEIAVYYPLEERFAPDLMAVTEVAIHRLEEESRRAEEESRRADAALARGRAEALLVLLSARGLAVSDDARARVLACADLATLDAWVRKAATASSLDDVWG